MLHESWALPSTLLTWLPQVCIVWRKVLQHRDNACTWTRQENWCACSSYSSILSLQIFARTTRATHANSEGSRPHLTNLRAPVSVLRRCTRWDRYLPFLCCLQSGTSCSGTPGWAGTCLLSWLTIISMTWSRPLNNDDNLWLGHAH